jgi:hypothetical protein
MKKRNILFIRAALCFILFTIVTPALAQSELRTSSTTTVVTDTLHYYLNKYHFKTGYTNLAFYPSYQTDATAVASSTAIAYCGSIFEVPAGETVTVTGLEGYVRKAANTANTNIPIRFYLFNLNPATGLPLMPPIDSISTSVSSTVAPVLVGGDFTNTATFAARTMTSSFAVAFRNVGVVSGDFAHLLRTAGATHTNGLAPEYQKYSDSYGFVSYEDEFYSTRDFNLVPSFGWGSDYEFMVARTPGSI